MNQHKQKYSGLKRWIKRGAWLILAVLMLGLLARLSLKTGVVRDWVKNFAVSSVNQQLTAELAVERLTGDLWKGFTASGLRLAGSDTLAEIDSIQVAYNILGLLDGQIEISHLSVYNPDVNLRQREGRWNFQDLLKPSQEPASEEGTGFALQIDDLALTEGRISVRSDSLPVESNFDINELTVSSRLGYGGNEFDVAVRDLSFLVDQTRLDNPVKVSTAATANNNRITLEKLVVASGNSLINSEAFVNPRDSTVQFDLSASPISWKDIARYSGEFPIQKDMQVSLGLSGKPDQFELSLDLQADGLESLQMSSQLQWGSGLVVRQLKVESGYINPEVLLSDTTLPSLQNLEAAFTGHVDISDYENGSGTLNFSASQISQTPYRMDAVSGTAMLQNQSATINLKANRQEQQLSSKISVNQIWSDLPSITANIEASEINPEYWMQDSIYAGNLSFSSRLSGRGWYPENRQWDYSLTMQDSQLGGRDLSNLKARGKFSTQDVSLDAQMNIRESLLKLAADFRDLDSDPIYDYKLETQDLDLGSLLEIENFTTRLTGTISGQGRGFDPAQMELQSSVQIDSSVVNGELISNFNAGISIRDTVAVVDSASLSSTIANGSFNGRMNIFRQYDSDNELAMNVTLKDLRSLAPLVNVDTLRARGTITGKMTPVENEQLKFTGSVDLTEVRYDEFFTASAAKGSVEAVLQQYPDYLVDLDLTSPTFSGVQIQDLSLMTEGSYREQVASGRYEFQFSSPNEGRIEQAGTYTFAGDTTTVRTSEFNIISDYRTLSLEKPFNLEVRGDTIRMDTMRVASGDSAFLEMSVPLISSTEQHGYIRGKALNTAVIQSSILDNIYFKGLLSGEFEIARKDTNLQLNGELVLSELAYQEAHFDSLVVETEIENERLKGTLSLLNGGIQLIDGKGDLPFKLGDPENLPPEFFDQPVSGNIRIRDIALENLRSLFGEEALAGTSGIFSFRGNLEGTAGNPEFAADASLVKGTLSGVSVDSVTAGVDYNHDKSIATLNASINSLRQRAAQVSAQMPVFMDMRTFEVNLPQENDSVSVDIETNNFNLAAMNDFVDRRTIREISGQLNGMVHIMGTVGDPKTDGKFNLENGAFRFMPAGIRVDGIQTNISFTPDEIQLSNFSANSGKGMLTASGDMQLDRLVPGNMDIQVKAENFRAANTTEYNAVVNLDARAQGTFTQPDITGNLSFISGFLQLRNFGEKSVESIQLDSLEPADYSFSVYDSLDLDMDVSFNRRFFIRNQRYLEMEIELDGQLDLLKEPSQDLQLFGTMTAASGYARPLGKRFNVEEGSVMFAGDLTNPELDIRTQYRPPQTQEEIVIWYIIEGTVENPQFKYESQPPMELANIISYTLFGQPFYALDSWKQVVANSGSNTTAADVALDVLLDRVETLATQKLGIDVVKIDNAKSGGETGTSITTGWYLNPKVFFAVQNIITGTTPDTSFLLEYLLQKNLKLIIRQGNGIRQGVDLRWNYEY